MTHTNPRPAAPVERTGRVADGCRASGAADRGTDRSRSSGRVADVLRRIGIGAERAVACRDIAGGAARLVVCPDGDGVVVSVSSGGPLRLSAGQVRRLGTVLAAAQSRADRRR